MPWRSLTIDGELVLIFGAIVAMEAVKQLPAGTVVLRRTLGGRWRAGDPAERSRLGLVAPFTPILMAVPVPGETADPAPMTRLHDQLGRARRGIAVLRVLGALELLLLLVAVPVGVTNFGAWGLATAFGAALFVAGVSAMTARIAWSRIDGGKPPARRLMAWCWPFSAATAAQGVLQHALQGASAPVAARLLLASDAFAAWVRPRAYDHVHGNPDPTLGAAVTEPELRAIVIAPPRGARDEGRSFCRRCGSVFTLEEGVCPACDISLTTC